MTNVTFWSVSDYSFIGNFYMLCRNFLKFRVNKKVSFALDFEMSAGVQFEGDLGEILALGAEISPCVCVLSYFVKKIDIKCRNHERSLLPI